PDRQDWLDSEAHIDGLLPRRRKWDAGHVCRGISIENIKIRRIIDAQEVLETRCSQGPMGKRPTDCSEGRAIISVANIARPAGRERPRTAIGCQAYQGFGGGASNLGRSAQGDVS